MNLEEKVSWEGKREKTKRVAGVKKNNNHRGKKKTPCKYLKEENSVIKGNKSIRSSTLIRDLQGLNKESYSERSIVSEENISPEQIIEGEKVNFSLRAGRLRGGGLGGHGSSW